MRLPFTILIFAILSGCGSLNSLSSLNPFSSRASASDVPSQQVQASRVRGVEQVAVNKYLWAASLDVLSFLPVQTVDPFTGVIVTGFGTPPNGRRAYRATVHVNSPVLSPRSLNVSLVSRNGAVAPDTLRAVEDAILTRARQLRVADR